MWPGLFSPFDVLWLWRASRSCAWSLPWAALTLLAGPRELAAGSVWATLDLPTVLQLWLPWSQSRVTSINIEIHQPSPTRDFRTWRWFLFHLGVGQFIGGQCSFSGENHYNVKLDFGRKIQQRLATILLQIPVHWCQLLQIIAQKEPKGWWGTGVGWILEQSRWCLLP